MDRTEGSVRWWWTSPGSEVKRGEEGSQWPVATREVVMELW